MYFTGRLKLSAIDGHAEGTEQTETFYTYGSRGFSVYRADNVSLVWHSGDLLEREISRNYPQVFNANPNNNYDEQVQDTVDARSDDRVSLNLHRPVITLISNTIIILSRCKIKNNIIYMYSK